MLTHVIFISLLVILTLYFFKYPSSFGTTVPFLGFYGIYVKKKLIKFH